MPLSTAAERSPRSAPGALPADAEWLLTDGRGGYALGAVDGLPRRRYHALWIARLPGAARRTTIVAGLDERVAPPSGSIEQGVSLLHAHWAGQPAPWAPAVRCAFLGHRPPTWRLEGAGADGMPFCIERTVLLQRAAEGRAPALLVRWTNRSGASVRLYVRPLYGLCDADHLPPIDPGLDGAVTVRGASWGVRPLAALPSIWLSVEGTAAFAGEPVVYRGFHYEIDRQRGYDHIGDRWSPGVLDVLVPAGQTATAAFALDAPCDDPDAAFAAALQPLADARAAAAAADDPLRAGLELGAADFLYRARGGRRGVLAGFPWFGEWGRDVFLALPGLTLARGDLAGCLEVLRGALPFLRRGLLPNIYGRDVEDSHYGSCDAALWFALAVLRAARAGADVGEFVPALASIADAYAAGTDLGLVVDGAGLLDAGSRELNATWMDARTAHGPVTPRQGQPVEIQALWYSLLAFLVECGETRFEALRRRCGEAFVARFWLADEQYLADRWHDGAPDRTVRPNMVLAAALPLAPWTKAQRAAVVAKAQAELVTPRGLRTLSPRDPLYEPRYGGGIEARDFAYHQGTVWPWLAGCYVEAALRAAGKGRVGRIRQELRAWLDGFLPELDRAGIDHVSEVFDGDAPADGRPQVPGGTVAQAWNTGELLRAIALVAARGEP